jgi:uncharacterized peroxidase-related enzyme
MPRVAAITPDKAQTEVKHLYEKIQKNSGGKLPNIFQHMGNSPTVLQTFLSLNEIISHTTLPAKLRSEIALAVAQANECQYCLSAHTTIGGGMGLPKEQMIEARKGHSGDPKTQAILKFAKLVVDKRGKLSNQEVAALKAAGVTDTELVEILLVVQLNMFTNYFNHVVDTTIDFPEAPKI